MIQKLGCKYFFVFWLVFAPWFVYSYFLGDNSLISYNELRQNYKRLLDEREYWRNLNSIYRQKILSFKQNQDYYYEKLAREMFLKSKEGEKVIIFVKPLESYK